MVIDLLSNGAKEAKKILADFKPALTKDEYIAKLDGYFSEEEPDHD